MKWAILILEQDGLISTFELEGEMSAGPIAWIDEVTICATVMRPGEEFDTFAMIETDFSGNVRRETAILKAPVDDKRLARRLKLLEDLERDFADKRAEEVQHDAGSLMGTDDNFKDFTMDDVSRMDNSC